jgi:hypothetical protein
MSSLGVMDSLFNNSAQMNMLTYNDYYNRLSTLAISLFAWENLPESVDERFLEKTIFLYGKAIFINDKTLGYLGLKCVPSGELNVYELPVRYTAFSVGYTREFPANECVLIKNNHLMNPTDITVQLFARRLYEVERTLDTNIKAQKTPVLILCNEKQRLTMQNFYMKYDGNQPFIFGDKTLNTDDVKVFKTDAPFIADKLMLYKHDIFNEFLSFLGIDNANTDKKERLIVAEAESNTQMVSMSAQTMLLTRQEACKEINKMFGLNVSVRLRSYDEIMGGSEEGGNIHNDSKESD